MSKFAAARHNMVESQIRTNKVTDPGLLGALLEVPRENFVPAALQGIAYVDEDLDLGGGRFLMEPMVMARLIQIAEPRAGDKALVIGCSSGYSTAVLGRLCASVVAVESDGMLASQAARTLADLGLTNAVVERGALDDGCAVRGPYEVILFDGAIEILPEAILDQLAEGGRLVGVVIERGIGRGTLVLRRGGVISRRSVFDAAVPTLPGFRAPPGFVF
ncbi:MAG: protein-L-isoaspartate O-methyltransferase family protein [Alphaproteobacteria bacterium]